MKRLKIRKPEKLSLDKKLLYVAAENQAYYYDENGIKSAFSREFILTGLKNLEISVDNNEKISKVIKGFVK